MGWFLDMQSHPAMAISNHWHIFFRIALLSFQSLISENHFFRHLIYGYIFFIQSISQLFFESLIATINSRILLITKNTIRGFLYIDPSDIV